MLYMSVFVMLSRLFVAALWSPERKGLASLLLFVMFIAIVINMCDMFIAVGHHLCWCNLKKEYTCKKYQYTKPQTNFVMKKDMLNIAKLLNIHNMCDM